MSIESSVITSFVHDVSSKRIALLDSLMSVIKIGKITGKLKIAIIVAALLALAAMAEIKVKVIEKPTLPSKIARKY